ncbi:potassium transporter TrkA [Halobacteriales archaeon Cl-PHB]
MTLPLAVSSSLEKLTTLLAQFVGLALLAATLAGLGAFAYRWYVRETVPTGPTLLIGLSGVAIYLSTTSLLADVIGGTGGPTDVQEALFHIVAFVGAAVAAAAGRRAGDSFAADVFTDARESGVETDVGRLVRSVGRVVAVELPQDVGDVVGYDPVPEATKAELAGKRFVFPRKLTVADLESRLVTRLKTDYAVGHVDVELTDDGSVEYLALGSRAAGIGPTLPPATNAVAVRADPAFAASAGDLVQVWETDPMRRVLTAELRGVADDVVTLAIDAADTSKVDPTTEYRLVTLPVDDRPDREFASLLRAADETYSSVTVEAGSPLHGMPVGALAVTVVSVSGDAAEPAVLPARDHVLAAGDVLYAIAKPEALRRLEVAATPVAPTIESDVRPGAGPAIGDGDDTSLAEALTAPTDGETDDEAAATADASDTEAGTKTPRADPDASAESADADRTDGHVDAAPDEAASRSAPDPASEASAPDTPEADDQVAGQADAGPFSEFEADFDAGEADWDEEDSDEDSSAGPDPGPEPDADPGDDDDLASLGADLADLGDDIDDLDADLDEIDGAGDSDPLAAADLAFDDDPDEDGADVSESGEDGVQDGGEEAEETGDEEATDDEDAEDDAETSSDGGKSFAQLKAEFESGDADWEDEVSDSPGGDMRLDE